VPVPTLVAASVAVAVRTYVPSAEAVQVAAAAQLARAGVAGLTEQVTVVAVSSATLTVQFGVGLALGVVEDAGVMVTTGGAVSSR